MDVIKGLFGHAWKALPHGFEFKTRLSLHAFIKTILNFVRIKKIHVQTCACQMFGAVNGQRVGIY